MFSVCKISFADNDSAIREGGCVATKVRQIELSELNEILESNKGKVVLVDFFTTWCGPCKREIPGFVNLYEEYKDKGLEIIGISYDGNGLKVLPGFIEKYKIDYPIYMVTQSIQDKYKIPGFPTTIIYDKNGDQVGEPHVGFRKESFFDEEIKKLLNK